MSTIAAIKAHLASRTTALTGITHSGERYTLYYPRERGSDVILSALNTVVPTTGCELAIIRAGETIPGLNKAAKVTTRTVSFTASEENLSALETALAALPPKGKAS